MTGKLLLIDGHSIINRAFYGLPDLTNAEGKHTGAVYGFLNILFRFIDEEKPDALAVAFDVHAPTFRHKIYAEYKGKRKPMPEELRSQVPLLKEVLDAMGVCRMEQAGLEADDLLGTAATRSERAGWDVTIVSGDRDLLQVATDHIIIAQPKTVRGQTTVTRYDEPAVREEWGVSGERFIELKALMGDTSDNIPGLPKVGEKTARDLMAQFGSGDAIFARSDEITKKGLRETVAANRAVYDLSKTLATIDLDAPFVFDLSAAKLPEGGFRGYFTPAAYEIYRELGFKNLLSRFSSDSGQKEISTGQNAVVEAKILTDGSAFSEAMRSISESASDYIGISILCDRDNDHIIPVAVSFCAEDVCYAASIGDGISAEMLDSALTALSEKKRMVLFRSGESYGLYRPACFDPEREDTVPQIFDTAIASYLLNPLNAQIMPEDVASACGLSPIPLRTQVFGKDPYAAHPDKTMNYAGQIAQMNRLAAPILESRLKESGMWTLFEEIEMPLSFILFDMERIGIRVRREELRAYGDRLESRIRELEQAIHNAAGVVFNINSPKQLGEILFERMGMPGGKKTKTGYSTAADVLEKLSEEHPIVRDILEYRGLTKLKSTYADGLEGFIREDGRIHTTFHQTVTATGRISSSDPNLQNIPMRTTLGREIRKVFVPEEGCLFADADYSQIELRILAAMSGDQTLIEAYREGRDIHAITASKVFGVPFEEVTPLMRRNAKAVNFGIVYGISSFGLSQNIDISRSEAADYIKQYFATYPGIKSYLDGLVAVAKKCGYAETLYGRKRPIPELKSSNFMQRSFGERVAMNAPIQGTAADIMKIAMIRVWRRLKQEGLRSRLILQIHDELLIETAAEEKERICQILEEEMTGAAKLAVPLIAECHTGSDWFEAK